MEAFHVVFSICLFLMLKESNTEEILSILIDNETVASFSEIANNSAICVTLDDGLKFAEESSLSNNFMATEVVVKSKTVELQRSILIEKLVNFTIRGYDSNKIYTVQCNCERDKQCNSGLVFENVKNLTIRNLIFNNCGSPKKYDCLSAIIVYQTKTVTIEKVSIQNSMGGGLCLTDASENVIISSSNFINNLLSTNGTLSEQNVQRSGGGLSVSFEEIIRNTFFHIKDCYFNGNSAKFYSESPKYELGHGHGGGLYIGIYSSVNVTVNVTRSVFDCNVAAFGGGAAILTSRNSTKANVSVFIGNCHFVNNKVVKSIISNGGGLQLLLFNGKVNLIVDSTTFVSNTAYFGGGTSIASSAEDQGDGEKNIHFQDCKWQHNRATSGAAVDISRTFTDENMFSALLLEPRFTRCSFEKNKAEYEHEDTTILLVSVGSGVVSVSQMNVQFDDYLVFEINDGSALMGVNAELKFDCPSGANFTRNIGINGGAISLQAYSRLNITNQTKMYFRENHARSHGGAIYLHISSDHMLFIRSVCPFYNSMENTTKIYFVSNTAGKSGQTIYFTALLPCQMEFSNQGHFLKPDEVFDNARKIFNFVPKLEPNDISTAPSTYPKPNSKVNIVPGEETELQLHLFDDFDQQVNDTIFQLFNIKDANNVSYYKNNNKCISENKISLKGEPNTKGTILLQTIDKPILSIILKVTMVDCPPGYAYDNNNHICNCEPDMFYGINCNNSREYHSYIEQNTWIGFIREKTSKQVFVSGKCYWFCNWKASGKEIPKEGPYNFLTLKDYSHFICPPRRRGILCSECREGYTAYYNSAEFECKSDRKCGYGWLYLVLIEFLPITLIILVVMTMSINIANGYIQGFLLYSHIIVTFTLYPHAILHRAYRVMATFLNIFYYPLDLKFFYNFQQFSFCLFKKVNPLDNTAMTYISILYSLILILVVVKVIKCFTRVCHSCNRFIRFTTAKNSAVHGLIALFLLSYTRCVETSLLLLQPATLYGINYTPTKLRVALYGKYLYFSSDHLKYAIPGIFGLILILIPSMMLFIYPLVVKVQFYLGVEHSKVALICQECFLYNQLKPFYDMFYSSFKDDHRYFAGLYLLYRIFISLPYYLPSRLDSFFITESLFIAFLAIHAIVQPYNKKSHNVIDALLLTNLVIINGLSCTEIISDHVDIKIEVWKVDYAYVAQIILTCLPMVVVQASLLYKYVLKPCWSCLRGRNKYQPLHSSIESLIHERQFLDSSGFGKYD